MFRTIFIVFLCIMYGNCGMPLINATDLVRNRTCGLNETLFSSPICEGTCENLNPISCPMIQSISNRCQCKTGYVRDDNWACILQGDCSIVQNQTLAPQQYLNITCDNINCPTGSDCSMLPRFCPSRIIPCNSTPRPYCKPENGTNTAPILLNCTNVHCNDGYHCEMRPRFCPPNSGTPCVGDPQCVLGDEVAVSNKTCDNVQCSEGEQCIMQVQCFSLHVSCDTSPRPKCVQISANTNSLPLTCDTDTVQCNENEQCVMKKPICPSLRTACITDPMPQCVPIDSDTNSSGDSTA